jgi:hypothetical protein
MAALERGAVNGSFDGNPSGDFQVSHNPAQVDGLELS